MAERTPGTEMRFWGWGEDAHAHPLPPHAEAFLADALGMDPSDRRPVARLEEVRLGEPAALPDLGPAEVRTDRHSRVLHAAGKSYPDLVRQRAGDATGAPDAVVLPSSHDEVRALLEACTREGVAVVPFGGGTSVVGGVEPERGSFDAVVALDLARMDGVLGVDQHALQATVEAGIRGPALERRLAGSGLMLGHLPQSWEYASIGGYAATRSAGQASTGYGRFDGLVLGARLAAPAGDLVAAPHPGSAAGPALRELIVGSEGALGVITEVTLRVRQRPPASRYEAFVFRSFAEGLGALRAMAQQEAAPDVARLSDEEETRLSMALAGTRGLKGAVAGAYLRARRVAGGCLAILGWEGEEEVVAQRRGRSAAAVRDAGGVGLGRSPGDRWRAGRFDGPYLRDELLDRGVMVETLETATDWSRLDALYRAVGDALRTSLAERGTPPLVLCHVSHLYPTGASLYFTFLAHQDRDPYLEQWRAAKTAASDAIIAAGGTITHHHAIGRDHAPWMEAEVGPTGVEALRALKARLDPAGIMNPGKLLPGEPSA